MDTTVERAGRSDPIRRCAMGQPRIRARRALIAVMVFVVAGLAAYGLLFSSYTNRFRLTIEIETPDGVKSASSVIETRFYMKGQWGPPEARKLLAEARGEAVFVDLGRGRHVIGVFGWGPRGADEDKLFGLTRAALAPARHVEWRDEYKLKGKGDLPPDYVPSLVTFTNLDDPRTARVVRIDDFEQTFGPGVTFRRSIVETTSVPIVRALSSRLRWLPHPSYLSGRFSCSSSEPHCLHGGNFTR